MTEDPAYEMVRQTWNLVAKENGWQMCNVMTKKRKEHVNARITDHKPDFIGVMREALQILDGSKWHSGQNPHAWKANIDWFIRPGTIIKIMERHEAGAIGKDLASW